MKILFAGGGTGGHLFPALALAEEFESLLENIEIRFIGTRHRIEEKVVPQKGYQIHFIWISGFARGFQLKNVLFPLKFFISFIQSFFLIYRFRPDLVIGTGGFVSGPVVYLAHLMKIPTLIQEQNSYPGVTTRILSRYADQIHISFEKSKEYLPKRNNIFLSGNPIRKDLITLDTESARRRLNLFSDRKTLFVFGGSQGAASINKSFSEIVERLIKEIKVQVVWQTGKNDYSHYAEKFEGLIESIHIKPFIEDMAEVYAVSDLVVCRAGAITLAELAVCGLPAILIPFPYAAANHQVYNAQSVANEGAAEIILEKESGKGKLFDRIIDLINNDKKLLQMEQSSLKLAKPHAAETIVKYALKIINPI